MIHRSSLDILPNQDADSESQPVIKGGFTLEHFLGNTYFYVEKKVFQSVSALETDTQAAIQCGVLDSGESRSLFSVKTKFNVVTKKDGEQEKSL